MTHGGNRLFLRCPTRFRHRPAQADMLHVDVWHGGRAVACDGGSYSYNSSARFVRLAEAAQHNVLTVDGQEPMRKFSRFLYLPWPRGTVALWPDGLRASHDGFAHLGADWSRQVAFGPGHGFTVRDRVVGAAGHRLRWHWRLDGEDWNLGEASVVRAADRFMMRWNDQARPRVQLLCADSSTAYGWQSERYGSVRRVCSLLLEIDAGADVELVFEFVPTN